MAIRYSGDVEIRVQYREGRYHGSVRSPGFRGRGIVSLRASGSPTSPENYDRAAALILREAQAFARKIHVALHVSGTLRGPKISRTFQSPCPYRQ
jgi:hypothetical protein